MAKPLKDGLSRRERQIMDVIYRRGRATAAEVMDEMPDPPELLGGASAAAGAGSEGACEARADGPRYVFLPTVPREKARRSALKQLVQTFFDGSAEQAVAALLDLSVSKLSDDELNRLSRLIDQARKEGR